MSNKPYVKKKTSAFWRTAETRLRYPSAMLPLDVMPNYVLLLTAVVLLLSGCHTQPSKPCERPAPVTVPALREPLPPQDYSISAGQRIKTWASELTVTSPTSKP